MTLKGDSWWRTVVPTSLSVCVEMVSSWWRVDQGRSRGWGGGGGGEGLLLYITSTCNYVPHITRWNSVHVNNFFFRDFATDPSHKNFLEPPAIVSPTAEGGYFVSNLSRIIKLKKLRVVLPTSPALNVMNNGLNVLFSDECQPLQQLPVVLS